MHGGLSSVLKKLHAFSALARYSAPENWTTSEPRLFCSRVHVRRAFRVAKLVRLVWPRALPASPAARRRTVRRRMAAKWWYSYRSGQDRLLQARAEGVIHKHLQCVSLLVKKSLIRWQVSQGDNSGHVLEKG